MSDFILEMKEIKKEFPGVKALDGVNFKVKKGEIHCLCGENGAGKSTLMKVLSGFYAHGEYSGDIILEGEVQKYKSIKDSKHAGIRIIYQELALVPEMSVYENIFLGSEKATNGVIDWNKTIMSSKEQLERVKLNVNPKIAVKELGVGKQQLVEIAKALTQDIKLLILDEPTSSLNDEDSSNLLKIIKNLKEEYGVSSIMISHKLNEVLEIADTVTVLRDGKTICSLDKDILEEKLIIKHMVGREISDIYPKRKDKEFGETVLKTKSWSSFDKKMDKVILKDINIEIKKGEVVGIAGLMGSGRTEFAHSIFGNYRDYVNSGELFLNGKQVKLKNTKEAIKAGLAYLSEDRKGDGLILMYDIKRNISMARLEKLINGFVINENQEIKIANEYKESLRIKTPSVEQFTGNLSGGNQQKVALSKWLFSDPSVLILDEPTRGIDVGAKLEIYTIVNELIEKGMSVLMISSELNELIGMSDRIYILSEGKITGEFFKGNFDLEQMMAKAI